MLVYQRRWNRKPLKLEGNSDSDEVMGTVYAKWADLMIAGEGIYDTQLVVGSLALQAGANVTIQYKGERASRAPRIFLLE